MDKNYFWLNDYKVPNGVHVYGRRYNPFGPKNYPFELKKTREYTEIRDQAIWATVKGKKFDAAEEDAKTSKLPAVKTNYCPNNRNGKNGYLDYVPGPKAKTKIQVAEGYKIELFADEDRFPDLANPVQMAFDNKGRLWVSTMASYPHYRIGDPLPKDKLIIFEDTDNDGKADKQINFADDLHIPIGFEISHDGVYASQSGSLIRLRDTDGDDRYDEREVMLSGFDDHDTHHAISAFLRRPIGCLHHVKGYSCTATPNPHSDRKGEPTVVSIATVRKKRPSSAIPSSASPIHGVWLLMTMDRTSSFTPRGQVFRGCFRAWSRPATEPT